MAGSILYVYDEFAVSPKFARQVEAIEHELASRGLHGEVFRHQSLGDMRRLLEERLRREAYRQVIFVGSEKMLSFALEQSMTGQTFGFIPLFPSHFSKAFDLPVGVDSIAVLAARVLVAFDIGMVNDQLFFEEFVIPSGRVTIKIDEAYQIHSLSAGALSIRNLGLLREHGVDWADPFDGKLELVYQSGKPSSAWWQRFTKPSAAETRLLFQQARLILQDKAEAFADGRLLSGSEFTFSLRPKAFSCIVGKQSRFLRS